MKKLLSFTSNQSGFYLPYVLFITALILLTVVTNTARYQQDVILTGQHLEQLQIETMIQIGHERFVTDYPSAGQETFQVVYALPYGEVSVSLRPLDKEAYHLIFHVLTDSGSEHQAMHRIKMK